MRINKLKIKDFRNLKDFEIDFQNKGKDLDGNPISFKSHAIIGQNGSGKSNLLEALITIFRDLDLKQKAEFSYEMEYEISDHTVEVKAEKGNLASVAIDNKRSSSSAISEQADEYLPSNIFTYYSGKNNRIEDLFHRHQKRFYDDLLRDEDIPIRRLFLCRNVHSQFVLLAYLIDDDPEVKRILSDLGILDLESVLFTLKRPYWFGSNPSQEMIKKGDNRFWYARGKVKTFLDKLWKHAIAPIDHEESRTIDFRDRKEKYELLYLFLPDIKALKGLVSSCSESKKSNPAEFFKYLESTYISDLIDEVKIKVKHKSTEGEISFRELSEGEQQLLTVLGLMRLTKEDETLFLLDEPDTHLNPIWKYRYFDDIEKIIGDSSSQIIITTHDPLMIGSLKKEQVRILNKEHEKIVVAVPDENPQGMGFSGLLKSELFGLRSTVDSETLKRLDKRNQLFAIEKRTKKQEEEFKRLNEELSELGFAIDFKDPYYTMFIKKMALHTKFHKPELTPEEQKEQDKIAGEIVDEILKEEAP